MSDLCLTCGSNPVREYSSSFHSSHCVDCINTTMCNNLAEGIYSTMLAIKREKNLD